MQKILFALLTLCIFQTAYSACPAGQFTNPAANDAVKGACIVCSPVCATCDSTSGACLTYISKFKGLDTATLPGSPYCAGSLSISSSIGYNSITDTCDYCADGCLSCIVDYNVCSDCRQGWDFDLNGLQCIRATIGLGAVVFALSALILLVVIVTCICACKL